MLYPLKKKKSIELNSSHRGYIPINTSTIRTSSLTNVTKPNQSESIIILHELEDSDPDIINQVPLAGPNQYPKNMPEFKMAVVEYKEAMYKLSYRLVQAFALGLDLPKDYFINYFKKPTTFLRLLCYPPRSENSPNDLFGSAPHTDHGFITLVLQDDIGGLQVLNSSGSWIDAPFIKGTFIMNSGDALQRWTNGKLLSTPHRVLNKSGTKKRYSIVFFYDPHVDTIISPIPTCISEGEKQKYDSFKYGDFIMDKFNRNYNKK